MELQHDGLKCHQFIFNNVSVFRNETLACKALSGSLMSGDLLMVQGKNGSGKTSLLKALAGLLPIYYGAVMINGHELPANRRYPFISYVAACDTLKPNFTTSETLQFQLLLENQLPTPEKIKQLLLMLELNKLKDTLVAHLSSGEKKRVQVAPLFWKKNPIILLDEPFVYLDKKAKALLHEQIKRHCDNGGIALISSHENINILRKQQALVVG